MDKTELKKSEKHKNILSAAYELFEKKGLLGVSIDDIVKSAGVAKGTFYLYFKNKYDLISKLISEKAVEYMSGQDNELKPFANPQELCNHIKEYIDVIALLLEQNRTLAYLIDQNVHICVNAIIENREGVIKTVYDNIYSYFERLGFSPQEIEIKLYLFINLTVSSCCNAVLRSKPYTLAEIKPHIYDLIGLSLFGTQHQLEQFEEEK